MAGIKRLPMISGRDFLAEAEKQLYPKLTPQQLTQAQREAALVHAKQLFEQATGHHIR